jgi:acid phosphatase type 7
VTRLILYVAVLGAWLGAVHCGGGNRTTGPTPPPGGLPGPPGGFVPLPTPTVPSAPQIFVGAGDIAYCDSLEPARQTGRLLDGIGGTVFGLGDNTYFNGTAQEFQDCYEPVWGRHKGRTFPVPGNHDYQSSGARPFYDYFGQTTALTGFDYYSHELGTNWHAIALNSNISVTEGSPQGQWLRADLAANTKKCTIAYWHHPLFTSGPNGPQNYMRDFWRMLYNANVDIILNGHDHLYERFAPQDQDGRPDPQRGIRQFIVGTGGAVLYDFVRMSANSEVRLKAYGVLKLTLLTDTYQWDFIPLGGAGDSGSFACH